MKSQFLESPGYAWSASGRLVFNFDFLSSAKAMRFPVVKNLYIRYVGTADTGSGGSTTGEFSQAYTQVVVRDTTGERVNLAGASIREIGISELENGYVEPTAIAASQTASAVDFYMKIPFAPPKSKRPDDFSIPVAELIGGTCQLTMSAANPTTNGITWKTGTLSLFAEVEDGLVPELKSRLVWYDQTVSNVDFDYRINGRVRLALISSAIADQLAGTAQSAMTITSRDLNYASLKDTFIRERYRAGCNSPVSTDPALQTNKYSIPLIYPDRLQGTGDMGYYDTLQVKTSLSSWATGTRLVLGVIQPRDANVAARVLGFDNASNAKAAVEANGAIKSTKGSVRIGAVDTTLQPFLPVKLK